MKQAVGYLPGEVGPVEAVVEIGAEAEYKLARLAWDGQGVGERNPAGDYRAQCGQFSRGAGRFDDLAPVYFQKFAAC